MKFSFVRLRFIELFFVPLRCILMNLCDVAKALIHFKRSRNLWNIKMGMQR